VNFLYLDNTLAVIYAINFAKKEIDPYKTPNLVHKLSKFCFSDSKTVYISSLE